MATTSPWLQSVRDHLWSRERFSFLPDRVLPAPPAAQAAVGSGPRVAFCGFPSDFSLAFLHGLLALDVAPAGIITSPGAHPAVQGEHALGQVAAHLGIPLLRLWKVNDEASRRELEALDLDAVVMASFDQIVRAPALAIPRQGWLNVHPSPLPRYRGPEPVYWAIADGVEETGITLHRAVPTFDAGPMLAQATVPVHHDDDAGTLTRRLCAAGVAVLGTAVERLLAGDPGQPLDMGDATYRPSIGHRRLADAPSAAAAERMVRAGWPNTPAYVERDGVPVFVARAELRPGGCDPGEPSFADGCLHVVDVRDDCTCPHGAGPCTNLEAAAVGVAEELRSGRDA